MAKKEIACSWRWIPTRPGGRDDGGSLGKDETNEGGKKGVTDP